MNDEEGSIAERLKREEHAALLAHYRALIDAQQLELAPLLEEKKRLEHELPIVRQQVADAAAERKRLSMHLPPRWWLWLAMCLISLLPYLAMVNMDLEWLRSVAFDAALWLLAWQCVCHDMTASIFALMLVVRPPQVLLTMLLAWWLTHLIKISTRK